MVRTLETTDVARLALFMSRLNPVYWPAADDAARQVDRHVGWLLEDEDWHLQGWLTGVWLPGYKTFEIETMGYSLDGRFTTGPGLEPLVAACERWAAGKGTANVRHVIGSGSFSCYGKQLGMPWIELRDLEDRGSATYALLGRLGYRPYGLLPEIYGPGNHGIVLLKVL